MPPFRLEAPDSAPVHIRRQKIIYTKNSYCDRVKAENWQELLEKYPLDVNPRCPGKYNLFFSHYHRLGTDAAPSYRTTTQDMLEQVFHKEKEPIEKSMDNYYTFNDNVDCGAPEPLISCPNETVLSYVTTMQNSYQAPRPYLIHKLGFPETPWMQNRKHHHDFPQVSSEKFFDEKFKFETWEMQKHKASRWVSYNPGTGKYTEPLKQPTV